MTQAILRGLTTLVLGLLLLPAIPAGAATTAAAPSFTALNKRVIDKYVLPRFTRLAEASGGLTRELVRTCDGDAGALAASRKKFAAAALAWAEVEFLRFGPMAEIGRAERLYFWPDPRGVTQRQVNGVVAKQDQSALDPSALVGKSAAVQGLGALELMLYDDARPITGDDEAARYRCRFALSAARSMQAQADAVVAEWQGDRGWRRRLLEPGVAGSPYKSSEEPAADFARALLTGLQMIQDRQVAPMIAATSSSDRAPRLPFSRAQLSARYIAASVQSAKALYEAMDLGRGVPKDKRWMPRWITAAFSRLANDAPAAVEDIGREKPAEDRARQLRMVRFHVENIRKLVGRELAPLAGLTIGFNELDGD
ncbi:MAG TPA: imelysin family protein [Hyphomicrobium sp.]|nr:imelysin family protein [Hyphomicrobium sp.]